MPAAAVSAIDINSADATQLESLPGIGPTNNLAELAVRFVVIDRRITQGTRSEKGRETCERLCTEFGGEFVRVSQASVAEAIAATARSLRITQIVLGRSRQSRWKILLRGSFIDQLMRSLPEIDLHIISTAK